MAEPRGEEQQQRSEIDTSPPFLSVKEAVTKFGGSGFWIPLHLLRDPHLGLEEFDVNKVGEQAAELERRLTAKELETLDVLREVETTKRILEGLKLKSHGEASVCATATAPAGSQALTPDIDGKGLDNPLLKVKERIKVCPAHSADLILTELNQAKLNLRKTTYDLSEIRASVETLNKKAEKQKSAVEMNHEMQLTSAGLSEPPQMNGKDHQKPNVISRELEQLNFEAEQFIKMAEAAKSELLRAMSGIEHTKASMRTAEMRWFAAKKMEEAAKAVEAVALAEMNCLERNDHNQAMLWLQKPETGFPALHERCSLAIDSRKTGSQSHKKVLDAMFQIDEASISKFSIMKKLEEATQEVKESKKALEEAFGRVEFANKQILETGEVVRGWGPERGRQMQPAFTPPAAKCTIPSPSQFSAYCSEIQGGPNQGNAETKHVIRPARSVGELLGRKQIIPEEDYVAFRRTDGHRRNGPKVSLSQMLNRQRTVPSSPSRIESSSTTKNEHSRHFFARNRRFGFIHLSIPLMRQSGKSQASKPR
uniref:WEB family protein n=1 Tax=Kalanchoe fedtschenkoi TaxID=63787 RepID=A0A7N0UPI7_KALFE